MLQQSKSKFLQRLYPADMEISTKQRKSSLSKQFQRQLTELMRQLYKTQPHYIRCIKPNEHKTPLKFVAQNCYEQLTYSGVFEAVAIRKQGFPFRLSHADFSKRYGKICKGNVSGGDSKKQCESVVDELKLDRGNVKIGKTRVSYCFSPQPFTCLLNVLICKSIFVALHHVDLCVLAVVRCVCDCRYCIAQWSIGNSNLSGKLSLKMKESSKALTD